MPAISQRPVFLARRVLWFADDPRAERDRDIVANRVAVAGGAAVADAGRG